MVLIFTQQNINTSRKREPSTNKELSLAWKPPNNKTNTKIQISVIQAYLKAVDNDMNVL